VEGLWARCTLCLLALAWLLSTNAHRPPTNKPGKRREPPTTTRINHMRASKQTHHPTLPALHPHPSQSISPSSPDSNNQTNICNKRHTQHPRYQSEHEGSWVSKLSPGESTNVSVFENERQSTQQSDLTLWRWRLFNSQLARLPPATTSRPPHSRALSSTSTRTCSREP
jgi:hypothetical protein